jgi:hypothetical protein
MVVRKNTPAQTRTGLIRRMKAVPSNSEDFCKKCGFNRGSTEYNSQVLKFEEIIRQAGGAVTVDMAKELNINVVFHILTPNESLKDRAMVESRAREILGVVNNDFNNYSNDANNFTTNNSKYRRVVQNIFHMNPAKRDVYLSQDYITRLPDGKANIFFHLNQVYFYPVQSVLDLKHNTNADDVVHRIRQHIRTAQAHAFYPRSYLNIWVIDMVNTSALGIGSFPWNELNETHGVITSTRVFFPGINSEEKYNEYKTYTHEIGHWCGLLHTFSKGNIPEKSAVAINMNDDEYTIDEQTGDFIEDTPFQKNITSDPKKDQDLLYNNSYNPLFMNFMDYTYDAYLASFTNDQIQKMRYMIMNLRKDILTTEKPQLPAPKDQLTIVAARQPATRVSTNFPLRPSYLVSQPYSAQYRRPNIRHRIPF